MYVLNKRISKEVLAFHFSGMPDENLVTLLSSSLHEYDKVEELSVCGTENDICV